MMMNSDVIRIISSYLGLEFFRKEILHKSWYYLLVNNLINFEILQERVLSLTFDRENSAKVFELTDLKSKLHELITKIATNKEQ